MWQVLKNKTNRRPAERRTNALESRAICRKAGQMST